MKKEETGETQRAEFRRYLEKSGVIPQLTRTIISLYEEPERPNSAMEYIKASLGAGGGVDVEELKAENDELKRVNAVLEAQVIDIAAKLQELRMEQEEG
eukprot:CAMPEP_0206446706 /NCGR_PEP_ID=MMETSP0324_2-20121206/16302_1 /ASSEMBLY_ACC=CAM_ASM_000836 /TAXON_ID=2866 /ORGANISM="Crypthecodinium cohnii, Strain Seligo" /LENGTH=98 /DNA_ID=CAMNT_0053915241 /DNA_START=57 /DNA_END=353 /DNA_ORIENTATION=+